MIYGIVGAPDTGKQDVASALSEHLNIGATSGQFPGADVALGLQADYRTELTIASNRALWFDRAYQMGDDRIYWHTLIDSLAYAFTRYAEMIQNGSGSDRALAQWGITTMAITRMADDTRWPDLFLYLPYEGSDEESLLIDKTLRDALQEYEQKYVVVKPGTEVETWLTS